MPIVTIRHTTTYRYAQPVEFGDHRLMFRPRDSHDLRLLLRATIPGALVREQLTTGLALLPSNLSRRLLIDAPPLVSNLMIPGARGAAAAGVFEIARKLTEIAITLKPVPHLAFQDGAAGLSPNQLVLTMQPEEGVSLSLAAKAPGRAMHLEPVTMDFRYNASFGVESPEAYERLLLDAMLGDSTLFTRGDEVEASWSLITPIHQGWQQAPPPEFPM